MGKLMNKLRRAIARRHKMSDEIGEIDPFEADLDELFSSSKPVFTKADLDDRQFPTAKNYADWLLNPEFSGRGIRPFQKQIEIGLRLFNDVCPKCTPKFYDPNHSYSHRLEPEEFIDRVQLMEWGVCPLCRTTRLKAIKKAADWSGLIYVAGQRSGKSVTTAQLSTYVLHRYLKIGDSARFFGLIENQVLHGTFTANTFEQAKKSLYDPFNSMIESSPWFTDYHEWLEGLGEQRGVEILKKRDSFVFYRRHGLGVNVSSPSKKNLRGQTRFLAAVDEIGWMSEDLDKVNTSGLEIHDALSRSLMTVRRAADRLRRAKRPEIPMPLECLISSPSSTNDPIMTLKKRYEHSKIYMAVQAPTWKINPDYRKRDLKEFFDANPVTAMRDYGAVPPNSSAAFVSKWSVWKTAIGEYRSAAEMLPRFIRLKKTDRTVMSGILTWRWAAAGFGMDAPEDATGRLMSIDLGIKDNSTGITVMHIEDDTLVVDLVLELIPERAKISVGRLTRDVILPVAKRMNVVVAVSDNWQSAQMMNDLEDAGIQTETIKVKHTDFVSFREDILNGERLLIPMPEMPLEAIADASGPYREIFAGKPVAHLIRQSLTVVDTGKSIEKGPGLTDDIFRSLIVGATAATDEEIRALVDGPSDMVSEMPLLSVGGITGKVSSGVIGCGHGVSIPTDHEYDDPSNDEEEKPRTRKSAVVSGMAA